MSHSNGQIDSAIEIITPENIAFQYRVAGPFRRLPAYLIDFLIRAVIVFAASIALAFGFGWIGLPGLGIGGFLVLWFCIAWFYGGLFEAYWNGQTPGKRLLQIRVLTVEGQPINGLQAVLRNLLRTVDALPCLLSGGSITIGLYLLGLATVTANRRFQRLGDLACGTMVIIEEPRWFQGVVRIVDAEALRLAALIPPSFQASRSLARALAAYVQRRNHLLWPRRLEIAQYVAIPLRDRFGLPLDTNLDQLLCALYHRTFITDRNGDQAGSTSSPFAPPPAAQPPAVTPTWFAPGTVATPANRG